jgi:hypothetical protein
VRTRCNGSLKKEGTNQLKRNPHSAKISEDKNENIENKLLSVVTRVSRHEQDIIQILKKLDGMTREINDLK